MALDELLEQLGNPNIKRYQKDDKPEHVKSSFSSFSFNDIPDAIIISNPKADVLKCCQDAVENGPFNVSALIIYHPGDYMDGRLSFVSTANKNKRTYHYDFIESSDKSAILSYIKEWELGTGVAIEDNAKKWLAHNAPKTIGKIKTQFGKKDVSVFDLQLLENELDKPYILRLDTNQKITLNDVQELCQFEEDYDMWVFISNAIDGKVYEAYNELDKILELQDVKSTIALLMSQLKFLINIKSLEETNMLTSNPHDIAEKISLDKYLNKYLFEGWQEGQKKIEAPAVNPWRAKKASESLSKWSMSQLCSQYISTTCAYKDLRFGVHENILLPYLMLALIGKVEYKEPITNFY
jgi:hypothetical protein